MQKSDRPFQEWRAASPEERGMDARKLSLLENMIEAEYCNINGIAIVKNGFSVFERYFHGCSPEVAIHVASVTKSILGALVGIAVRDGYIESEDTKVLSFFPEYVPAEGGSRIREITLRPLLTMTAPYPFEAWREPLDKLTMREDWITYTLDMLGRGGEIGSFKYSTAGAHLLSAILTRATGKSARQVANERLFRPAGMRKIPDYEIKDYGFDSLFGKDVKGWVHDPLGNSTGGWGLTLTTRDMARFGLLCLNRGVCDGRQIIPESWIKKSTKMNSNHYGYLWWLFDEGGASAFAALGDGGNAIFCIPRKHLVVAIASEFMPEPKDRWTLVRDHILPAVID